MIHRERRNYLECKRFSREEDEQFLLSYIDRLTAFMDNPQALENMTDEEFDRAVDLMREHSGLSLVQILKRATNNFHRDD